MLATVTEIADFVAEAKGSTKRIGLSVDEWNVWRLKDHMAREAQEVPGGPFRTAPALAEDEQDLADALVVGCLLVTLLRHADRVQIACLAQLVNVIAADPDRRWWACLAADHRVPVRRRRQARARGGPGRGPRRACLLRSTAATSCRPSRPLPSTMPSRPSSTLFAVNRVARPIVLEADWLGFDRLVVEEHRVLGGADLGLSNTATHPDRVVPFDGPQAATEGRRLEVELPAFSWNVVRMSAS